MACLTYSRRRRLFRPPCPRPRRPRRPCRLRIGPPWQLRPHDSERTFRDAPFSRRRRRPDRSLCHFAESLPL